MQAMPYRWDSRIVCEKGRKIRRTERFLPKSCDGRQVKTNAQPDATTRKTTNKTEIFFETPKTSPFPRLQGEFVGSTWMILRFVVRNWCPGEFALEHSSYHCCLIIPLQQDPATRFSFAGSHSGTLGNCLTKERSLRITCAIVMAMPCVE